MAGFGLGYNKQEKLVQGFTRLGLCAKGLVYCLFSLLAILAATGMSKHSGSKEEAFKLIHEQPFGKVILIIIAICLLGYVTLRFMQALNKEGKDRNNTKGILQRLGKAGSGLIYLGISVYAFKVAVGKNSGGDSKKMLIEKALELDLGYLLVGAVGLFIIGQGIYQMYRGISGKFMKKVELHRSNFKKSFERIGLTGNVSRGIVLCILGFFLVRAAWYANAKEAEGTEGVFSFLQKTGGIFLMAIVAAGLFAYGVFMFVRARHEKIRIHG